jgi:hypothetical protein
MRGDDKTIQLRRVVERDLLSNACATTQFVLTTSGVAQRFDVGAPGNAGVGTPAHPLAGRLIGDLPLSAGGRIADHFHTGQFVLLDRLDGVLASTADDWSERVASVLEGAVAADCPDAYRTATGILVRPDGVIAWAIDSTDPSVGVAGLSSALHRWAGAPSLVDDSVALPQFGH